jgi:hypothetical protein
MAGRVIRIALECPDVLLADTVFGVREVNGPVSLESPRRLAVGGLASSRQKLFSSCDPNCSHVRQHMGMACVLLVSQQIA